MNAETLIWILAAGASLATCVAVGAATGAVEPPAALAAFYAFDLFDALLPAGRSPYAAAAATTMRPSSIGTTRSTRSASCGLCVTTTIVT